MKIGVFTIRSGTLATFAALTMFAAIAIVTSISEPAYASSSQSGEPIARLTNFVSEKIDKIGGGRTGLLDFSAAHSADCDPELLSKSHWIGSNLAYLDESQKYPKTRILICVTKLTSNEDAVSNFKLVVKLSNRKPLYGNYDRHFNVSGMVGADGNYVAGLVNDVQIFFRQGRTFTLIQCVTPINSGTEARSLAIVVARREVNLLISSG
jgi:hypothetical protein